MDRIQSDDYGSDYNDIIEEIESEGMILSTYGWTPIDTIVKVYKETDKAYFGDVTVHEVDYTGRVSVMFSKEKTWIPKSMCNNVWWICTILFEHKDKVSNRRFDGY